MERQPVMSTLSLARKLAMAGIFGPILFTLLVILQSLLQSDYSDVKLPISALAAWPLGWIQIVNFGIFGLLMIAFAVGLHLGVERDRAGSLGPLLLVLSGIGILLAGLFPWRSGGADFHVPIAHRVGAVLAFAGAELGLVMIAIRMRSDPKWRSLVGFVLACGLTMTVLFVVIAKLAVSETAPLHSWAGLLQRITLAVWFPCLIVLALRLRQVTQPGITGARGSPDDTRQSGSAR